MSISINLDLSCDFLMMISGIVGFESRNVQEKLKRSVRHSRTYVSLFPDCEYTAIKCDRCVGLFPFAYSLSALVALVSLHPPFHSLRSYCSDSLPFKALSLKQEWRIIERVTARLIQSYPDMSSSDQMESESLGSMSSPIDWQDFDEATSSAGDSLSEQYVSCSIAP